MLLGKHPEFFRQKEKNVGLIRSTDGGDGGLYEKNEYTSPQGMTLPGMRAVKPRESNKLNLDEGQNFSHNDLATRFTFRFNEGKPIEFTL